MKIRRVVSGIWVVGGLLSACATQRSAEPAAPASADEQGATRYSAPAAQPGLAAPAPPPAAPAPQGLDQPKSHEAVQADDFPDLESAERALNQAKSDLDRLALAAPMPTLGRDSGAAGKVEKKEAKRSAASATAAAPASNAPGVCENACRAFASLSRAANAVCRLDGDGGAHCTHAKRVVADSQLRVSSCACQPGQ